MGSAFVMATIAWGARRMAWYCGGSGGVGATVETRAPCPVLRALRRRRIGRRKVARNATALLWLPVIAGRRALGVLGRGWYSLRSTNGKTAVFGFVPGDYVRKI